MLLVRPSPCGDATRPSSRSLTSPRSLQPSVLRSRVASLFIESRPGAKLSRTECGPVSPDAIDLLARDRMPLLLKPVSTARVVWGSQPLACTIWSRVAPSGRVSKARTASFLLGPFGVAAGLARAAEGTPDGSFKPCESCCSFGSRAMRRGRFVADFSVVLIISCFLSCGMGIMPSHQLRAGQASARLRVGGVSPARRHQCLVSPPSRVDCASSSNFLEMLRKDFATDFPLRGRQR